MVFRYTTLLYIAMVVLPNCFADMGYGSVGVLSGAGSSSGSNSLGSQGRSNSGAYNSRNTVNAGFAAAPVYSVDTSSEDNTDDAGTSGPSRNIAVQSGNGVGAFSGASSSSFSGNQAGFLSGSRMGGAGSNVAAFGIGGNNGGGNGFTGRGDNVQVVQVDSSSMQDIGSQIQSTIQGILQKFGFTMQQNFAANNGLYQPGRTFVIQSSGVPKSAQSAGDSSQTQFQYQGQSMPTQQQINIPGSANFGQTQVSFSASQPVVVSYRLIGTPGRSNAGLAFSVISGLDQGSQAGAGAFASASNVNSGSTNTGGVRSPQQITGAYDNSGSSDSVAVQQKVVPSNYDSNQNSDDSNADSGSSGYATPVPMTPVVKTAVYAPTVAPVQQKQKVRYVAQANKKTESNSNVAYEQDSS